MNVLDVAHASRQFNLAEEVIPESQGIVHKYPNEITYANHGKQIVRNQAGYWICAYIATRGLKESHILYLCVSKAPLSVGGDFHPACALISMPNSLWPGILSNDSPRPHNVCLMLDEDDHLTVVIGNESRIYSISVDASGPDLFSRLTEVSSWSSPVTIGTDSTLWDAALGPAGELIAIVETSSGALAELQAGEQPVEITAQGTHATFCLAADGARHVAWEEDRRVFYSESKDGVTWAAETMVAQFCSSWPSLIVSDSGQVIIAYQGEGKVDLRKVPELYNRLRPGAGCTISYAVKNGNTWRLHDFLRSSEIVLKRRASSSVPLLSKDGPFIPHMEEFWRPTLAVDRHGVIWMFYLNTTRRHSYFTRFEGEEFGTHYEARGAYDCLSRTIFIQKQARKSDAIGFMIPAAEQIYFDHLPVPSYCSTDDRRVVFLDNLEVAETHGIEQELGQWEKHGPLTIEARTDDPVDRFFAWAQGHHTDDGFLMHYMGQRGTLRSNAMPGRATSKDGLHWVIQEPFDIEAMSLDGQPFPNAMWRPVYLRDDEESDPERRYKGLQGDWQYREGMEIRTWNVVSSPDGMNWRTESDQAPVVVGDISVSCHIFRDDDDPNPQRRFKGMFLMGANAGRAPVLFTSPDLLHWDHNIYLRMDPENVDSPVSPVPTGPIFIDPDGGENPYEEEVHDAVLWREHRLLMAHYDAFYCHHNQHVSKALAVSRDGRHFHRVMRGKLDMSHGNCGEWDSGRDRTSIPIRVGDELWMWFCGMPASYFGEAEHINLLQDGWTKPPNVTKLRPWGLGLAKLRVDGWAYLRLTRDVESGYITTIPFDYRGGELVLNGTHLKHLQVELRNAENTETISCFTFAASEGITVPVEWPEALPLGMCRIRFILQDPRTRLYSFGFRQV